VQELEDHTKYLRGTELIPLEIKPQLIGEQLITDIEFNLTLKQLR